jgi:RnfABCDGE-type electron transport complex D subunit
MSNLYNVASNPHVRDKITTSKIMLAVIISLLPASLFGIYNFGWYALVLILVTIASCVASEYVFNVITKRKQTINDLSAVVTGLLLALNLPSTLPWWMAVIGGVFSIIIVKMLFGGLGQNFMNPALGGRCFLMISFTSAMTNFSYISDWEAVSGATPLAILENGGAVNTMDMLIGRTGGTIGETSVIALMIGAIFLCAIGVIDAAIPVTYIVTLAVFVAIFGGHGLDVNYICAHICGGGVILGAFFMATDYVTSPITPAGKIIFGLCLGILTGIFRIFGPSAEGVSYAIIFCNLLVPLIERVTVPKAFGLEGGKK